jgi:hypothetical protein
MAPAKPLVSLGERTALDGKMMPPLAGVEGAAKIAISPLSGPLAAVVLLPG